MKTYRIPFEIIGDAIVTAETPDEAQRKFERISIDEMSRMWGDLRALEPVEMVADDAPILPDQGPEGLARLSADEVRI